MSPNEIKALLAKRRVTWVAMAEALECSHTSVYRTAMGQMTSRRIATAIAAFLGRTTDELWPGKYPETYRRGRGPDAATFAQFQAAVRIANAKTRKAA